MKLVHTAALALAVLVPAAHAASDQCSIRAVQTTLNSIVGYDTDMLNGGSIYPHCFMTSRSQNGDMLVSRINQRFFPRRGGLKITERDICGLSLADTIALIQNKLGCR